MFMRSFVKVVLAAGLCFFFSVGVRATGLMENEQFPSPEQMWEKIRKTLPPFSYSVVKDEIIPSYTDPSKKLRRMEVEFVSQVIDNVEMKHHAVIYLPEDPEIYHLPKKRGKAVIVTHPYADSTIEWNYAEPIAARTDYPTMDLLMPPIYRGEQGESGWLRRLRAKAVETGDPGFHDFIRCAIPYLQAMDILSDILEEEEIHAIIGGHSKRAYYAYTAAAMDPERIASVIFMGCERLYYREEFPEAIKPFTTQKHVRCPVLYIGASNEGGYEMFNINKIQDRMRDHWSIEYIPNYRHAARSEKQFLAWQMWVSHIFDGRAITRISDLSFEETDTGTIFRARIDSPNKIIQVKAWYVYCDDVPYWRDLVWYPDLMQHEEGNYYRCEVDGKLPDAWLVEVKDIALGFPGYISSLPQDITHKPTEERTHRGPGGRNWTPKKKKKN